MSFELLYSDASEVGKDKRKRKRKKKKPVANSPVTCAGD
jgi:hypothetical protein